VTGDGGRYVLTISRSYLFGVCGPSIEDGICNVSHVLAGIDLNSFSVQKTENGSPPTSSAQTNEAQHMSLTELKDCLVIMRQHHSLSPLEMIKQAHRFFHLFYIKASELPIPSIPELTTAKSVNFTLPAVAPRHDLEIPTSMEILKCSHYNSELLQSGAAHYILWCDLKRSHVFNGTFLIPQSSR
jgi:hypothetical protein